MASMAIIYNLLLRIEFPSKLIFFITFPFINQVRRFGSRFCFHLQARKAHNMVYQLDTPGVESTM
jgi:hypothetical protein